MKADIQVISEPTFVKFDCPHCEAEVEMDFGDFRSFMITDYPGDWKGEKLECPHCEKEIEVDDVEWD